MSQPEIMEMKDDNEVRNSKAENNQPIDKVTTTPPKKQRSQKQIEWSRELGRRSSEFKRKKKEREVEAFSSGAGDSVAEEPKYSNDKANDDSRAGDNKVENKVALNIWYIIVPLALLIGGGLISWNKYKDSNKVDNHQLYNSEKDKIIDRVGATKLIKSSMVEME